MVWDITTAEATVKPYPCPDYWGHLMEGSLDPCVVHARAFFHTLALLIMIN